MARAGAGHGVLLATPLAIAGLWFVFSLAVVSAGGDGLHVYRGPRAFHCVGISLPWAGLFLAIFLHDERPVVARRLMLAALLASTLLASLAIVHHVWIDPALGRAIRSLNWPTVEQALGRLWMHEILLTVNGPLLALASWFLLRWMDGPMARRQHRPGSFVRAR